MSVMSEIDARICELRDKSGPHYAKTIRRRTATWPSRVASYWDLTEYGGGFMRVIFSVGAVVVNNRYGLMLDLSNGKLYFDKRFEEKVDG